jgi:hypothetical protein
MLCQLKVDDEYETPAVAWALILQYLDKSYKIWDPFYASGRAADFITSHGFHVEHHNKDFFEWQPKEWDMVISNPPYSKKKQVLQRLVELGKPFALLIPITTIATKYFISMFKGTFFRLLLPPKRFHFLKNGVQTTACAFETCWLCVGLNEQIDRFFPATQQIIYLNEPSASLALNATHDQKEEEEGSSAHY